MTTETLKREIKFTGVQPDLIQGVWPIVSKLVSRGLALEQGLYKTVDIKTHLLNKKMQLWVAIDPEENKIVAVLVTQIANYPQGKACWVVLVGGVGMDDWIRFVRIIKLWAKAAGCDRILAYSRDGWIRKMAPYGFKKIRTLIGCSLEDENENL